MSALNPPPANSSQPTRTRGQRSGLAQLSIIEHALCSLDPALSLVAPHQHKTGYFYTDANKRRFANVSIFAALGLSSRDEYFLWGLLALTFNQPQPSIQFLATPHFCLKKLGYLEVKGGKQYAEFRATIKRLAGVFYQCDAFYDPRLQKFQDTGFGLLKYSLPQRDDSSRAWRLPYAQVVMPEDPEAFIRILPDELDQQIADQVGRFGSALNDLSLNVSTGRVVDFRATEFLRAKPTRTTVPLIYPRNLDTGYVAWPKEGGKKPHAIEQTSVPVS